MNNDEPEISPAPRDGPGDEPDFTPEDEAIADGVWDRIDGEADDDEEE